MSTHEHHACCEAQKTALWTVLVGVPQVLMLGYLFNHFF